MFKLIIVTFLLVTSGARVFTQQNNSINETVMLSNNSTMANVIVFEPVVNSNLTLLEPKGPFMPIKAAKINTIHFEANSTVGTNVTKTTAATTIQSTFRAPPLLKKVHDYLIVVLLVAVMFAMGCSITWTQVWQHVCHPVGVIIGMISQFVLLPFSAYVLIIAFQLDPLHATGLLILACSPGGVTSNIFTYFCEGDLSLSVTMTSFSTVVALFMMPFNVWLYGQNLETESLVIPYSKMSVSLLSLTTPVIIGMLVNWKLPRWAPFFTQAGSVAGFAIIVICQTLEVFIFPDIFNDVPAALYIAEFLLPLLGLVLGFGAASIFKLPYKTRRTIAIEAGIQNVGTALTIITLSFPFQQLRKVWLFPFMYAFSMLGVCCVVAVLYHFFKQFSAKKTINITDCEKSTKKMPTQHRSMNMHSVIVSSTKEKGTRI